MDFVPRTHRELFPVLKKLMVAKWPFMNLQEEGEGSRWRDPITAEKMEGCRWVKLFLMGQVALVEGTD